jgi:hypothetical protein
MKQYDPVLSHPSNVGIVWAMSGNKSPMNGPRVSVLTRCDVAAKSGWAMVGLRLSFPFRRLVRKTGNCCQSAYGERVCKRKYE